VLEPSTLHSNVYSVPEIVLLKWLTVHYHHGNPHRARRITNFDSHLADGLVLAAVMLSHVPGISKLQHMNQDPRSREQREANAKKLIVALLELGIQYPLHASSIALPVGRDLLLLCMLLYQKLPGYLPKTTIEFKGSLDEEVVKHVELSNPSSQVIVYTPVRLL
jgi:hypothetical protein